MKRYRIKQAPCPPFPQAVLNGEHLMEDSQGEWVKYEDAIEEINKVANEILGFAWDERWGEMKWYKIIYPEQIVGE